MNKVIFISLLFLFLTLSFSKTILFIHYRLNLDFIKNELCENKNKPQLKCNGKCYLKNQVKKAENNSKNLPESLKQKDEIKLIASYQFNLNVITSKLVKKFFTRNENCIDKIFKNIFIPPPNIF